ncbi:uncharacterized protein LACBIDRAFT_331480 [Laccaria bicolor S238N-H82]|uniref:Predicted protein n=1 Tax=Laccaria bicolor (strain S238N-H82 / ATCC MYA-4686) TaxID=486041 RepID=B0DPL5_LACBS|nr:uncharacterized protein LACBIDRAFT_331480 [Laccaria bicolor S238N-H82]EDR03395.1 predicted protein [Laccaria bicolor S238N-H82]|eukprot:XP_001885851.1 predicted protein [Laccaria bicolor S238N-H82]
MKTPNPPTWLRLNNDQLTHVLALCGWNKEVDRGAAGSSIWMVNCFYRLATFNFTSIAGLTTETVIERQNAVLKYRPWILREIVSQGWIRRPQRITTDGPWIIGNSWLHQFGSLKDFSIQGFHLGKKETRYGFTSAYLHENPHPNGLMEPATTLKIQILKSKFAQVRLSEAAPSAPPGPTTTWQTEKTGCPLGRRECNPSPIEVNNVHGDDEPLPVAPRLHLRTRSFFQARRLADGERDGRRRWRCVEDSEPLNKLVEGKEGGTVLTKGDSMATHHHSGGCIPPEESQNLSKAARTNGVTLSLYGIPSSIDPSKAFSRAYWSMNAASPISHRLSTSSISTSTPPTAYAQFPTCSKTIADPLIPLLLLLPSRAPRVLSTSRTNGSSTRSPESQPACLGGAITSELDFPGLWDGIRFGYNRLAGCCAQSSYPVTPSALSMKTSTTALVPPATHTLNNTTEDIELIGDSTKSPTVRMPVPQGFPFTGNLLRPVPFVLQQKQLSFSTYPQAASAFRADNLPSTPFNTLHSPEPSTQLEDLPFGRLGYLPSSPLVNALSVSSPENANHFLRPLTARAPPNSALNTSSSIQPNLDSTPSNLDQAFSSPRRKKAKNQKTL